MANQELQELYLELERRQGLKSLTSLMENTLNYKNLAPVHEEVAEMLKEMERGKRKGLFLLPRGHLKSTLITISWVIQKIIEDPNVRILISNALLDNSKGFLREIKGHFERNERFRALYGDHVNPDKWSETQIVVNTRTKFLKEPTIQVTSVDKSVVSQHYDIIIADDVVNRENTSTKEQRQKVQKYYKDLLDLLEPGGMIVVVGTRWHFDDLYGWLIRENERSGHMDFLLRKVWVKEGVPLFPQKFSPEYIRNLKVQKGPSEFNKQYMNEVVSEEDAEFSYEKIRFSDSMPDLLDGGIFISIDPALSRTEASDYSGIVVNQVLEGKWYIREARRMRLNPTQLVDEIFFLKRKYAPNLQKIAIEDIMYTAALDYDITRRMRETNEWFSVEKVKHRNRNKEDRIRALIPLFDRENVIIDYAKCVDLVEEIQQFPSGEHDDVIDALAYQLDIVKASSNFKRGLGTKPLKDFYMPVFPRY